MIKKYWPLIAVAAGVALLLFFLLQGDKQHDSHKDDKADVIADHDTLKAHGVIYSRIDDSLRKEITQLKSVNTQLKQGQATTRRQLDAKTAEVRSLAKEVQQHNRDTGEQARRIDSLVAKIETFAFLLSQYQQYADSINNVNDSLSIGHETVKKADDKHIAELQSSYDKLFKAYMDLFKTSEGLQKSLKRQKLKTKTAAVLGAAASIILLVK